MASAADIVVASLPSNEASEEVALGADGVLAGQGRAFSAGRDERQNHLPVELAE